MVSIWTDKEKINLWIKECCESNQIPELVPKIKWRFNSRFRSRLGDALCSKLQLRFSAILWTAATPEQKENHVKHETSHLIAWTKFGAVPAHGDQWKFIMLQAGQIPTRTHNVKSTKKTLNVICTGCKTTISIGSIRFRRMKNGKNYLCTKCGSKVEFVAGVK